MKKLAEVSMSKKITLADVAKLAGVSASTASITLSGKKAETISAQTRDKVWLAARELGYALKPRKPRTQKRSSEQKKQSRQAIALIIDEISLSDPFLEAFKAIREQTSLHGFISVIYETGGDSSLTESIFERINAESVVGVLFATHRTRNVDVSLLEKCQKPIVLLNCHVAGEHHTPAVLPGDLMGGYQATQHLLDQGFKRIAHITGELENEAAYERMHGYRRALISNDCVVDESLIREGGWFFDDGYRETKILLELSEKPDAIFCGNDTAALGCYFALREAGIRIPEDVAVLGYDNLPIDEQVIPKLSSMILPYGKMGSIALEVLLGKLSGQATRSHTIKVESELVTRESTLRLLE